NRRVRSHDRSGSRIPPMSRDNQEKKKDAGDAPADLAVAALGISADQLARNQDVIDRLLDRCYFSLDEEGKVSAWNPQAEARFGWPGHEVLGEDFCEYLAPPDEQ